MLPWECEECGKRWLSDVLVEWVECPKCRGLYIKISEKAGLDLAEETKLKFDGYAVDLETNSAQFEVLENIMCRIVAYFVEIGRIDELEQVKGIIENKY